MFYEHLVLNERWCKLCIDVTVEIWNKVDKHSREKYVLCSYVLSKGSNLSRGNDWQCLLCGCITPLSIVCSWSWRGWPGFGCCEVLIALNLIALSAITMFSLAIETILWYSDGDQCKTCLNLELGSSCAALILDLGNREPIFNVMIPLKLIQHGGFEVRHFASC
jgi:hypothetical protein